MERFYSINSYLAESLRGSLLWAPALPRTCQYLTIFGLSPSPTHQAVFQRSPLVRPFSSLVQNPFHFVIWPYQQIRFLVSAKNYREIPPSFPSLLWKSDCISSQQSTLQISRSSSP